MPLRAISPELLRNVDAAIALLSVPFSLFDHLSKKADVSSLQKDLDLLRAQLVAEIVDALENATSQLLTARISGIADDLIAAPPPIFDDATKDRVTSAIRKHESTILLIQKLRRLPLQINRLNGIVFWLIVITAVASLVGAGVLTFFDLGFKSQVLSVLFPIFFIIATITAAIIRQTKVQYAYGQILKHNS